MVFLMVLVFSAATPLFAQDEEYAGMKGTDTPEFQDSSDTAKCFVFRKYARRISACFPAAPVLNSTTSIPLFWQPIRR